MRPINAGHGALHEGCTHPQTGGTAPAKGGNTGTATLRPAAWYSIVIPSRYNSGGHHGALGTTSVDPGYDPDFDPDFDQGDFTLFRQGLMLPPHAAADVERTIRVTTPPTQQPRYAPRTQ